MKALVVVASCLKKNSSANLCHIAYIQGLIDNGYDVDVLSVSEQDFDIDTAIELPDCRNFTYRTSLYTKLSRKKATTGAMTKEQVATISKSSLKSKAIRCIKDILLKSYGVYGQEIAWVRKASSFTSKDEYEYIISLSTPHASHLLAYKLLSKGNVRCKKWIQIWEDPWTKDLYTLKNAKRKECAERFLVSKAETIIYVSPLTLKYQRELFPEFSNKMKWKPLPYYYKNTQRIDNADKYVFGYFGDYYSYSRDLKPFYDAAKEVGVTTKIFGNTDISLKSTENIVIKPRISLEKLHEAENHTGVLVFLSNLSGGQIPGKIYQYSSTEKYILFILDGTEEEKQILKDYFSKFNRFIFCDNTPVDISKKIRLLLAGEDFNCVNKPVEEFSPQNIVKEILLMSEE